MRGHVQNVSPQQDCHWGAPSGGGAFQTAYLLLTSPTGCWSFAHVKTESLTMLKNWHQSFRLPEESGNCSTRIFRITCGAENRKSVTRQRRTPCHPCPLRPHPLHASLGILRPERKQHHKPSHALAPRAHILARAGGGESGHRLSTSTVTGFCICRCYLCEPAFESYLDRGITTEQVFKGRDAGGARRALKPGCAELCLCSQALLSDLVVRQALPM